jgi:hypothetical protein
MGKLIRTVLRGLGYSDIPWLPDPKSHAAAFAVIVYQSAWLKCYYPAAFFVRF